MLRSTRREERVESRIEGAFIIIQPQSIRGHRLLLSEKLAVWNSFLRSFENDCQARYSFKKDNFRNRAIFVLGWKRPMILGSSKNNRR
jgi:hypothetical protein